MKYISLSIFVLIELISTLPAGAQQENQLFISVSPAVLSGAFGMQAGLNYKFQKYAIIGEAGTNILYPLFPDYRNKKYKSFRTSIEIKQYRNASNGVYYSFQSAYNNRKLFQILKDAASGNYNNQQVRSNVLSFSFKVGKEIQLPNQAIADVFIGIGERTVFTKYPSGYSESQIRRSDSYPLGLAPALDYNKTVYRLHLPIGIRVLFKL